MKIIQTLSDIEFLKADIKIPMKLIKEIEQDFLQIYEAENDDVYLLNFRLPIRQALFVLEQGDDVLGKLDDLTALEYVEKIEVDDLAYYRCALRRVHDFQLYYSLVNTHRKEIENWLSEHAEWNEGMGDFNV